MFDIDISNDQLLSIDDICKRLSISRSTLDRWRGDSRSLPLSYLSNIRDTDNDGVTDFPPPSLYFGKSPRWAASTINNWLANQQKKRELLPKL